MPRNNEDFQVGHRGSHQPSIEGPRLHNLIEGDFYPKDSYENLHHFHGSDTTRRIIKSVRGNPDAMVTIHRAVPAQSNDRQWLEPKLKDAQKEHAKFLKTGVLPEYAQHMRMQPDEYHNWVTGNISDMQEKLNSLSKSPVKDINHGDWVTLDRNYAQQHAEGREGKWKIISKTVPAKHIRNDGNDLNEWGYFPHA